MAEKYQARSNGQTEINEVPEKSKKEQRKESSDKVAKVAAKGAAEYFAPGVGSKVVDMAAQTKAGQQILSKAGDTIAKNPILSRVAKKLDDRNMIDAADSAVDMLGGNPSKATGNAMGNTSSNMMGMNKTGGNTSIGTNSNLGGKNSPVGGNSESSSGSNPSSYSSKSSSADDLTEGKPKKDKSFLNELMGNSDLLSKFVKWKYIAIFAGVFFGIVLLMTAIVSAKDFGNLDLTNDTNSITGNGGAGGDALAKLAEQGQWWVENVDCYFTSCGGNGYIDDPFYGGSVRKDCSGFASAYMGYVAGVGTAIAISDTLTMINPNSGWSQNVQQYNWKYYLIDEISELQPGDVLLADKRSFPGTKGEHAEIYVDESHTFGWGSVKSAYPTNNTLTKGTKAGRTVYSDSNHDYVAIYRYEGVSSSESDEITSESVDSSLENTNIE